MNPRLVICLFVSALLGAGTAAFSLASGAGPLVALLAYSGTSSVALFGLALATIPRKRRAAPARAVQHPRLTVQST